VSYTPPPFRGATITTHGPKKGRGHPYISTYPFRYLSPTKSVSVGGNKITEGLFAIGVIGFGWTSFIL
jgi:hypothetical protein